MTEALDSTSIEDQVASEVEQRKTDREILGYFNNFYLSLPSLNGRDHFERMAKMRGGDEVAWKEEVYKTPYGVLNARILGNNVEVEQQKLLKRGYSEQYVSKTRAEFLKDVEEAIKKTGIDRALLQQQVEQLYSGSAVSVEVLAAGSRKFLLPVWIELRKMGYSTIDLWS